MAPWSLKLASRKLLGSKNACMWILMGYNYLMRSTCIYFFLKIAPSMQQTTDPLRYSCVLNDNTPVWLFFNIFVCKPAFALFFSYRWLYTTSSMETHTQLIFQNVGDQFTSIIQSHLILKYKLPIRHTMECLLDLIGLIGASTFRSQFIFKIIFIFTSRPSSLRICCSWKWIEFLHRSSCRCLSLSLHL